MSQQVQFLEGPATLRKIFSISAGTVEVDVVARAVGDDACFDVLHYEGQFSIRKNGTVMRYSGDKMDAVMKMHGAAFFGEKL